MSALQPEGHGAHTRPAAMPHTRPAAMPRRRAPLPPRRSVLGVAAATLLAVTVMLGALCPAAARPPSDHPASDHPPSAHPPNAHPASARLPLASTPLSRTDLPWWRARLAAKAADLHANRVDLVFYGDSITQDWEQAGPEPWRDFAPVWQHFYGGRHAINLGFKGDTTAHLLWRIENGEAEGINPKAAVILIGANNFGKLRWPADVTEQGIARIVDELRRRLPHTRLLLLGVLPSIRNPWVDQQTARLNAALARRYAGGAEARFIDVGGLFRRAGQVDPSRFLDPHLTPPDPPLHPSAQAQADLAAAIEPTLAAMLGDRPRSAR